MSEWAAGLAARNLPQLFQERLINEERLFARCDDGRLFTYGQFWALAGRLANKLKRKGARRGDRIAVQVDKSIEALALFWACVRSGLVYLPLNPAYTKAEVSYFLTDAEPKIFIVSPSRQAEAADHPVVLTLDDQGRGSLLEGEDHSFTDVEATWDDLAAILYTSGTTGRSKGAMLSHGNLASNALALIHLWRFTGSDVLLHALPIFHTHGLFVGMNTLLLSGGQLLLQRRFNADDVLHALPHATTFMGVPTFYTRLLAHDGLTRNATRHMRLFISGSAPLLAETHRAFEARTGHVILERYGMTETGMIASNPYAGTRRAGTVGFPLPHVEIKVTDRAAAECAHGVDGMIEVRGPNVFQGYWRNPQKTREEKRNNGFFITGDIGRIDDGGYLVISGRAKDLIITGGFNVYPREIEEVIDAWPGVIESAVVGLPHPDFGEAVAAVVAARGAMNDQEMMAHLKAQLAGFKVPKRIFIVAELPRNAMGKVQKAELRKRYAETFGS